MEWPYVKNGLVYFNKNTIIEQFVEINSKWNSHRYCDSEYPVIVNDTTLLVDVRNLLNGSHIKVFGICPLCDIRRDLQFGSIIRFGHTKCKSCVHMSNLIQEVYTRLTVLEQDGQNKHGQSMWLCECNCEDKTILTVIGNDLRSGKTQSCGCLSKELARARCGENHYRWDFSKTTTEREIDRTYPEIRHWAYKVKELDKFTCQTCGDDRGGNLESHHLNGYKDFPEQRLDLQNGITLCTGCHKEFHSWMGGNQVKCTHDNFTKFCEGRYPNALFLQK